MASDVEWVEIRCPRTGEPMFANLDTGECLWEVPLGAHVKAANNNQWWELYDANSGKNYYHHSTSNRTVWKKPPGAEILPLTKLQAKSGPDYQKANGSAMFSDDPSTHDLYQEDSSRASTSTYDKSSIHSNPPPVSPYAVKPSTVKKPEPVEYANMDTTIEPVRADPVMRSNSGGYKSVPSPRTTTRSNSGGSKSVPSPRTTTRSALITEECGPNAAKYSTGGRPNKQGKIPPPVATKPATLKRTAVTTIAQTRGEETPGSTTLDQSNNRSADQTWDGEHRSDTQTDIHTDTHNGRQADREDGRQADIDRQEGERGERCYDNPPPLNSVKRTESAPPDPMAQHVEQVRIRVGRSIEVLSNIEQCDSPELTPDIPPHGGQSIPDIVEQLDRETSRTNMERLKQNRHESRYSSFHDYSAPTKYSSDSKNRSIPDNSQDSPSFVMRRHSAELSPAPHKEKKGNKKAIVRSPTSPIPKLPKDKEFVKKNINRPRGMFKKVSIATMLAHSKDPIKKPIILTQDKQVRKDAVICFKNLQEYMGDTKLGKGLRERDRLKRAADLAYTGWQKICFRDEFYMQVIKQTTLNPKPKSLEWGWKLMCVYLYYFPPTIRFQSYLEGYLYKNTETDLTQPTPKVPVQVYAEYCHERLAKMVIHGGKHGTKKPTEEDISHGMNLPFKKSMFGATLDEVMELQKESHPNNYLPWVLTLLAEKVILFGGYSTEGIFRVPGDIDKVTVLKMSLDNGEYLQEFPTSDAPVCASLLKEWLRELYDPAISHEHYQKCLDNCEHSAFCASIISELPDINRLVVAFVIRFLQGFLEEETVRKTKMTADNLAMIFAPNLLRCPSTDLQVAMDNSKWEMTFVRTLINNLDTSYMDGLV